MRRLASSFAVIFALNCTNMRPTIELIDKANLEIARAANKAQWQHLSMLPLLSRPTVSLSGKLAELGLAEPIQLKPVSQSGSQTDGRTDVQIAEFASAIAIGLHVDGYPRYGEPLAGQVWSAS